MIKYSLLFNKFELKYFCKKTISSNFWLAKDNQSLILLSIFCSLFKSTGLWSSEHDEEIINLAIIGAGRAGAFHVQSLSINKQATTSQKTH